MPNRGIAPPDLATTRGKFRLLAGDSVYAPLIPAQTGFGDYTLFSDDEVDAYLTMAEELLLLPESALMLERRLWLLSLLLLGLLKPLA